jgi:hypothetical protein
MALKYSDDITLAELARLLAEEESTNGKIDRKEEMKEDGEPEVSSAPPSSTDCKFPPIQFVDEMEFYTRKF